MTIKEYQKRSYTAIQPHPDKKDEILNWAVGLSEEIGEVMNHIKHTFWGNEPINKLELAKEIGDILWYSSALATVLDLNLEAIANMNVSKLEHRFGGNFSEEQSKQRHEKEKKFSETELYRKIIEELFL